MLPDIRNFEVDNNIQRWRWLAVKPGDLGDDPLGGLVQALCHEDVLPELKQWTGDIALPEKSDDLRDWLTRFSCGSPMRYKWPAQETVRQG